MKETITIFIYLIIVLITVLLIVLLSKTSAKIVDEEPKIVIEEPKLDEEYFHPMDRIVEKNMTFFDKFKLSSLPKKSSKCALFVELMESPYIRFCIKNVMTMLGNGWSLYILYCDENIEHIKNHLKGEDLDNVNFIRVGKTSFNPFPQKYNEYFMSEELWNQIDADNILIFQTDSYMRKKLEPENEWLKYDYVGAPWTKENLPNKGGNGGFSLRNKKSHLNAIRKNKKNDANENEDLFFSKEIDKNGGNFPQYKTAMKFSVEEKFYYDPIAVHKYWLHFKEPALKKSLEIIRKDSSYPYLSMEMYYELSSECENTIFINNTDCDTEKLINMYLKYIDEPVNIILFSNIDINIPEKRNSSLDKLLNNNKKIKKVFTKNALYESKKIKCLPVGPKWQFNSIEMYGEDKTSIIEKYQKFNITSFEKTREMFETKKEIKILTGDMLFTETRKNHLEKMKKNTSEKFLHIVEKLEFEEYLEALKKYKFVFSPPGFGVDCHRHWETLMLGSIPIILKSDVDSKYKDLPVWLVDSYEQVTDKEILRIYKKFSNKKWKFEKLYADYWKKEFMK